MNIFVVQFKKMTRFFYFFLLMMLVHNNVSAQKFDTPPNNQAEYEVNYKRRILLDTLAGIYIPKDTKDAFAQLNKKIDVKSKEKFIHTSPDTIATFAVKSLGSWMIRNWGFYEGSRLGDFLRKKGVYHPEDQAAFLVIGYYRFLNNLPLEEDKRITEFQKKRKAAVDARKRKGEVISSEKIQKPKQ